jgi:hypothetical protein
MIGERLTTLKHRPQSPLFLHRASCRVICASQVVTSQRQPPKLPAAQPARKPVLPLLSELVEVQVGFCLCPPFVTSLQLPPPVLLSLAALTISTV